MSALLAIGLILAQAPATVPAPPPAPEEKLVCRYQDDPDLGSHIARRKKVCMRSSEWKDLEALNGQMKRRMQEHALPTIQGQPPTLSSGN